MKRRTSTETAASFLATYKPGVEVVDLRAYRIRQSRRIAPSTQTDFEVDPGYHVLPGDSLPGHAWVYFARVACAERFVKIGFARNLFKRQSALQNGCPYEIRIQAFFQTTEWVFDEARLHQRFAAARVRGEWFVPTIDLDDLIEAVRREQDQIIKGLLAGSLEGDR